MWYDKLTKTQMGCDLDTMIIHEKRKISGKSLIFTVIMLLACIYLIYFGAHEGGFFYLLLGIIGAIYFLYALVMALLSAAKTRVLLTIGPEGITDSQFQGAVGFLRYEDIGEAKAITILAACELGKRRQAMAPEERPELTTATRIYRHMHPVMQDLDTEEFWVLLLNQSYKLIKKIRVAHGGISEVSVDIRIIIREAVLANATIVVVCHNHPSGSLRPSKADDALTQSIEKACQVMRLRFMDHIIVTDGNYYSYHEEGRL